MLVIIRIQRRTPANHRRLPHLSLLMTPVPRVICIHHWHPRPVHRSSRLHRQCTTQTSTPVPKRTIHLRRITPNQSQHTWKEKTSIQRWKTTFIQIQQCFRTSTSPILVSDLAFLKTESSTRWNLDAYPAYYYPYPHHSVTDYERVTQYNSNYGLAPYDAAYLTYPSHVGGHFPYAYHAEQWIVIRVVFVLYFFMN